MLAVFLGLFVLSLIGTDCYRRYALTRQILDVPSDRSAHDTPIPRGGGVVFLICFLLAMVYFQFDQIGLVVSAFGVALIGYFDDKYTLTAGKKLLAHLLCSAGAVLAMGGMPDLYIGPWLCHFNVWTSMVAVIYLVWMLNLYNFMDGINGIAGFEAICVSFGMVMLYAALGVPGAMVMPLVLIACVGGFLVWNFPKAKIFMGDAGSGFLGFLFGIWSLQSAHIYPQLFWSWLILLGVFVVDTTVTLAWRMVRKEPLHLAHAMHAYQHAFRRYQSHRFVTLAVVIVNLLWLWPIAVLVGLDYFQGYQGLVIAYLPLIITAWILKAGRPS
ncbi:MAG: glycosyltransferase family 4 protein [Gammaproteobacteria bacterium]|nr:glycosyltransferase family 4 protein [Gammaproteobacteria bacterium]